MKLSVILMAAVSLLSYSSPNIFSASAKRLPDESYAHAVKRAYHSQPRVHDIFDTPEEKQVDLSEVNYEKAPVVLTRQELMQMFKVIRDTRFLKTDANPLFSRRISWLYPDDGCFVRAAVADKLLAAKSFKPGAKLFAFGDLVLPTPYSPDGRVLWWYHVAPVVAYMGDYYVLDPAVNFFEPSLVQDWYNAINSNMRDVHAVVCSTHTYGPFDMCTDARPSSENSAIEDQKEFLRFEWDRLSVLGFNPEFMLGDFPPWLM